MVGINGAVNQDLCDLMPLYASVIDVSLRAVKSYLGGRYSNMLLLLLSNVISKSLGPYSSVGVLARRTPDGHLMAFSSGLINNSKNE